MHGIFIYMFTSTSTRTYVTTRDEMRGMHFLDFLDSSNENENEKERKKLKTTTKKSA